jgi:hypothetical protein
MRNISDKSRTENENMLLYVNKIFLDCAVYEIIWGKNMVETDRPETAM